MIAMPFHPSNVYTIDELNANLADILHDVEQKALVSLDGAVDYSLQDKIRNGKFYVEQGIIAGCAGGGFENGSRNCCEDSILWTVLRSRRYSGE